MIWIFILGAMLGSLIGVMITCLCGIAKQSDERTLKLIKVEKQENNNEQQGRN